MPQGTEQGESLMAQAVGSLDFPLGRPVASSLRAIFHPSDPPIVVQSISRDVPSARARGDRDRALREQGE